MSTHHRAPLSFQVHECIPDWVAWQQTQRITGLAEKVRGGINYSIVLMSACYVEGFFEATLLKVATEAERGPDSLRTRLVVELRDRISGTMGSDRYDAMFGTVFGVKANALLADTTLWDSIKHLFHFRNMLAHGRSVSYDLLLTPIETRPADEFTGGYAKTEDYLFKKKLLTETHISVADNWHYFKDPIADHFWDVANRFVSKMETKITSL